MNTKDVIMQQITQPQLAALKERFLPDQPGPLIGLHILQTGHGTCFVDRWPDPRVILTDTAQNISLTGDPAALHIDDVREYVAGFVEATPPFVPLLRAAFPNLVIWDRVIYALTAKPRFTLPTAFSIRRLEPGDARALQSLNTESAWISKTWDGPRGLAASGYAWGAFVGERLAAVANIFFLGDH